LEVEVIKRLLISCLFVVLIAPVTLLHAGNRVLAEVRFAAHGAEKNAGVWVDGQYVGYVKELKGDKKLLLLPGKHEIVVKEPWYDDYSENLLLQPGEVHTIALVMTKSSIRAAAKATAELKIDADPARAAVFVDKQFVGHVDEFNGPGQALLLTPGEHQIRLELPGYQPFETVVTLRDHQKLKIATKMMKGSITEAGALVSRR
jgi:PEGA domain